MPQWEDVATQWAFRGPLEDPCPRHGDYAAQFEAEDAARSPAFIRLGTTQRLDSDPDDLVGQWQEWREATEHANLAMFGDAGSELVSIVREPTDLGWPGARVFASFKRVKEHDAPPPPRPIGFGRG